MTSSINPNIPVPDTDLDAVPIQENFAAAYNDINGIQGTLSTLGNMSTQSQNNVTITGGAIAGTALNAGTVPSTALAAIANNTVFGNVSGISASPSPLSQTQLTNLINVFTSGFSGAVPASGGGTSNFLRADGTFAVPPGTGTGTVTSVSVVTANGVSGTVATSTTTPAITLTLGNITPVNINASGTIQGSNLTGTNTGDQTNITGNAGTVTTISGQIVAGTNISITGSGTTVSPYDISTTGVGTVTTVSVVPANGFNGTVANPTTSPAITLKTTVTGILKGDGTGVSAAIGDTDYQNPITLTTTGTSGAATFIGDTLNIPQYSGGAGSSAFNAITSGTNTTAAMVVGSGGTLGVTGSGTIAATSAPASGITGTTLASNVVTSSLTSFGSSIALGTPASGVATNLTGTASGLTAGAVSTINGLITQGTNVTITGSGTSGSPYNIAATGGGGGGIPQSIFVFSI